MKHATPQPAEWRLHYIYATPAFPERCLRKTMPLCYALSGVSLILHRTVNVGAALPLRYATLEQSEWRAVMQRHSAMCGVTSLNKCDDRMVLE